MSSTLERRRNQYRTIYELLHRSPRIKVKTLSSALGMNRHATSNRLKEAFEEGYILVPQLRKRSYANLKEYMYFVNSRDSVKSYMQYIDDNGVVYHAVMSGFANLWLITREEINIEGDIIFEGFRSDYHVAFAPNQSWKAAIKKMRKKIEAFNPKDYKPSGIIKTHLDEPVAWDSEYEVLSREFKYNGRKALTPLMKAHLISGQKIYEFLDSLPEYCTVFTRYFPETISAYDPYLFMFETDYEDFIIDIFSELPTSPFFFKVSDRLFVYTNMAKEYTRCTELYATINKLQIPLLMKSLLERGILKSEAHTILEYYWGKSL
jgi:DNA-binding Lrp family transcriptional regulator